MTNRRNRRELAALNKGKCEELPGRYLAQNSNVPRSREDYINQISDKNEGRVKKSCPRSLVGGKIAL